MPQTSGTIGTETLTASGQRVIAMTDNADFYDSDASKIFSLLHKADLTKEVVGNRQFDWREGDLLVRTGRVDTTTGTATTVVKDSTDSNDWTTIFRVDDLIMFVTTREIALVTAVAASTLTVVRGYGTIVAATGPADGAVIVVLGTAKIEGSNVRTVLKTTETKRTNYTQEFSMPVKTNWELDGQDFYGMDERRKQQFLLGIDHQKDISLSLWFGQKNTTGNQVANGASTDQPRYLQEGIYYQVEQAGAYGSGTSYGRLFDAGGALSETEWDNWLRFCKRFNQSGQMWVFASSLVWQVITGFAKTKIVPNDMATKTYGFEIMQYVVPGLKVNLIEEKVFENYLGLAQGFEDVAICLDLPKVTYRYQQGWDTKLIEDIVKDGTHAYVDEYLTICGVQVQLAKAHGIMKGITG